MRLGRWNVKTEAFVMPPGDARILGLSWDVDFVALVAGRRAWALTWELA